MIILLVVLIVLAALLLMLIVLAQDPKSGGLTSGFQGAQLMGVQKTTDLLEKLTWGLGIALFVLAISTSFAVDHSTGDDNTLNSVNVERARQSNAVQPAQPATSPQNTAPADGKKQVLTPAASATQKNDSAK
jgi:preprotein translocase subunit SecG